MQSFDPLDKELFKSEVMMEDEPQDMESKFRQLSYNPQKKKQEQEEDNFIENF